MIQTNDIKLKANKNYTGILDFILKLYIKHKGEIKIL